MQVQWAEAAIFQRRRRGSVTQQIVDHLRRRIVSGDLPVNRQLPPLRKLAMLYGVSVPTMHGALHALAALGFVRIAHGVGVFVSRPRSKAALLNHAWQQASTLELALMRAAIDERMPTTVAMAVARGPAIRPPKGIGDLNFFAAERSSHRFNYPEFFLQADLAFHQKVASCVRGAEMTVAVHQRLAQRLMPALMSVAEFQSGDRELDAAHVRLAQAVVDGRPLSAARLARTVAVRELRSLDHALG